MEAVTDRQAAEAPKRPNYDRLRAEVEAGAYPFYAEDEGELFARAEWLEAEVDALSVRLAQAEQERDEALQQRDHDYARFSEAKRGVIDESKSVMVERDRAERAEVRLREYEARVELLGIKLAEQHVAASEEYNELTARLREYEEALKAVFEVAAVAHEGDPWYCENEGVDAEAAFALARPLVAASGGREAP